MLKSLQKKPRISDYHVLGVRSFYILLSSGTFLDFLLIYALFRAYLFLTEKQTPQTFSLLECMSIRIVQVLKDSGSFL